MELRPYQSEALQAVWSAILQKQTILLQAATGAGKTIIFSSLIQRLRTAYPKMRIGVLAHREQLIRQAYDKLLKVWSDGKEQIGIVCSSVSDETDFDKPILIGSPQTMTRHLGEIQHPIHLLIVDEAHRLPSMDKDSQYALLMDRVFELYPRARLFGVTATPYRLNWGYIYGKRPLSEEPGMNWFSDLTYQISIDDLQKQGYLCECNIMTAANPDLSNVKTSSTGDFKEDQLSEVMSAPFMLETAVKAVKEHGGDRKHIVVFAVTIKHAELLRDEFNKNGFKAEVVHSEISDRDRQERLKAFDSGTLQVLCNVGVLTEGWDSPATDCIVGCRPTKSTALYVQMVGRGLRIAEGKTDCLYLDLSGNYARHGDPNEPKVTVKRGRKEFLPCPKCGFLNDIHASKCVECGYVLRPKKNTELFICPHCGASVMSTDIKCASCGGFVKEVSNKKLELIEAPKLVETNKTSKSKVYAGITDISCSIHHSKKGGVFLRVRMNAVDEATLEHRTVCDYWAFEGDNLYGIQKARRRWLDFTGKTPPTTTEEALQRVRELSFPPRIELVQNGQYWNVKRYMSGVTNG